MALELSEQFFAKIAGWEAMKQARALLAGDRVLSSNWSPPVLKGVVQEGTTSYRAGLVIKDEVNIDNLCTCRASREWGTICGHSVAVGLHHLTARDAREMVGRGVPTAPGLERARTTPRKVQGLKARFVSGNSLPVEGRGSIARPGVSSC
ncbi:MAG TPA: hypothetical protein VK615_07285, partial [Candidatus Binatia bacterium]|nr:hypothetical protein [Candidatus Binatia bacterium]